MTLCLDIHGHKEMRVKIDRQHLPVRNMSNNTGAGSVVLWRECQGVIEDVPAGAVLTIYNPTNIRQFVMADTDATLKIRSELVSARAEMTGGISEVKAEAK